MLNKFLEYGIGNFFVLIVSLITTPIITNILSPDEYGKASLFITFCNIASLIVLAGMDQVYMRFYYEEGEDKHKLLKNIFKNIAISFCIFLICLMILRNQVSKFILGYKSMYIILILILNIITLVFMRIGFCSIRMQQKGKIYSYSQIIGKIIYVVSILIFYYIYKNSYKTLVLTILFTNLCISIFLLYIDKVNIKNSILSKNDNNYNFKEKIKFGIPFVFSAVFIWIFKSSDTIIIKKYIGYEYVGIYSIAFSLIGIVNIIQSTFMNFWTPIANEAFENDNENTDFFISMNEMVSYLMLIICSSIVLLKDIIHVILGKQYYQAVYILPFLIFIPLMSIVSETTVQGINFMKKSKYHIYISMSCAIINIVLNIILVNLLQLKGAAIATAISYCMYFYLRTKISMREYTVDFRLKKFYIAILFFLVFVLYNTYNSLNIYSVILYILFFTINSILYKSQFIKIIKKLKKIRERGTRVVSR